MTTVGGLRPFDALLATSQGTFAFVKTVLVGGWAFGGVPPCPSEAIAKEPRQVLSNTLVPKSQR